MSQEFTSKNTSVNSKRLPAIFKKVDFSAELECASHNIISAVIDYGCGKYSRQIDHYIRTTYDLPYFGYDKYNQSAWQNGLTSDLMKHLHYQAIVCSNVLNVIKEDEIVQSIVDEICSCNGYKFFTVYEGNRSGVGRATKNDCYQRNRDTTYYMKFFSKHPEFTVKHGVITNCPLRVK